MTPSLSAIETAPIQKVFGKMIDGTIISTANSNSLKRESGPVYKLTPIGNGGIIRAAVWKHRAFRETQ